MESVAEIRKVLQSFQDGYSKRDISVVDKFIDELFADDKDALIIGTGSDEWCRGREGIRELIESDWKYWGDVLIDVEGAHISLLSDVSWLAANGTVSMKIDARECRKNHLEAIRNVLDSDENTDEKLFEILRGASNTLFETEKGDNYIWPFRFTAVLVKKDKKWLFHQIQFSFPTTRFPDERLK